LPRLAAVKLDVQIGSHAETMELTYRITSR
ncbi:MAG: hypothetical protein JWN07_3070, partial [Hyphomicrobiales bacterium]|nr:hypothetical protein [Hyphomicrobiales bacterium]